MKNPQITFAPTFLTHLIARIGGVMYEYVKSMPKIWQHFLLTMKAWRAMNTLYLRTQSSRKQFKDYTDLINVMFK